MFSCLFVNLIHDKKAKWNERNGSLFSCFGAHTLSRPATCLVAHLSALQSLQLHPVLLNPRISHMVLWYPCGSPTTCSQAPAVLPSGNLRILLFPPAVHMAAMILSAQALILIPVGPGFCHFFFSSRYFQFQIELYLFILPFKIVCCVESDCNDLKNVFISSTNFLIA